MTTSPEPPCDRADAPADRSCDVLVIGGGPAGSTIAALLAARGRDVALIEKGHHPRFHIGESLLPANAALFDRLGVRDGVEAIGIRKYGAEFVSPDHDFTSRIAFGDAWDKSMPFAWQVRRSELDELLFRNAAARGARTFEGSRARQVHLDDGGASVQIEREGALETWRARYVVDASGRDTLMANQLRSKRKNARHNSSALYAHFAGVGRPDGEREGDISIFWFAHGWFWLIPLADGATSIGAVCWPYYLKSRAKPLPAFFDDTIAMCPKLAARLEGAPRISDVTATGNYSYESTTSSGERFVMLGDAFAFVDPVFSSGVYLAMYSAFAGEDVVEATLDRGARAAAAARRRFDRSMRNGPREFSWFIFRVTNPTMRGFFMDPRNPLRVKEALISLLAGDIHGRTPIWPSIFAIKALYYLVSFGNLRRTWHAWKRRRANIRDVEAAAS
jgi:flavin-dependent dehydrogenase